MLTPFRLATFRDSTVVHADPLDSTGIVETFWRRDPCKLFLLVASLLALQGVENFAMHAAAKAYVLRLGEALQ